jgi:hypothetical protein
VLGTQKLEICLPWKLLLLWGGFSSALLVCSRIISGLNASTFCLCICLFICDMGISLSVSMWSC